MKLFLLLISFLSSISYANTHRPKEKNELIKEFKQNRDNIELYTTKYPDSAFLVATKMMEVARESENDNLKSIAYSTLAFVKISQTNLDEAEKLLKRSIHINKTLKNSSELALNYNYIALIYQRKSDFVKASDYFFESLHLAESQKNYKLMQRNYNGISMVFCDQDDFDKALKYAKKSNEIAKLTKNRSSQAYSVAILAEVYREIGNFELANANFTKSYNLYVDLNDEFGQAWCLTNWSLIYDSVDIYKTIDMELEAQRIWDNYFPDNLMSMTNLGNLGWSYFIIAQNPDLIGTNKNLNIPKTKAGLLSKAEEYYMRCLEIAKRKKNVNTLLFYSGSLAQLQAYKGDTKSAYENLLINKFLTDSLYSQENKNKIASIESEKELLSKQAALEINRLKLKSSQNQKWYFIGALLLLSSIGIILLYQNRERRKSNINLEKTNLELENANASKAKLFGIINHDLRSPLASLVNFINLQQLQPDRLDKATKDRLMKQTLSSTEQLLITMEDLLLWSKGQMLQFNPEIESISVSSIFEETAAFFNGIQVNLLFDDSKNLSLNTDSSCLKTILRNLTANSIKAIAFIDNPTIIWKSSETSDIICLSITDNGPGINKEQLKVLFDDSETAGINSGLGLHIVRDMAKSIDCMIEWNEEYKNGTEFKLKFRKKLLDKAVFV